ncbi:MarR family winged helix-turn-helix transcriptional regulator [Solirubrobacter soli]|uniref:MarR family winged helix-turn-helix transcriptional regulator n=1 Tax=Solirubrobacter soli TaxID=363832 RepID=UPI00146AB724|nr:MarR family transcriptional regulator [Solirubrobacter soli]
MQAKVASTTELTEALAAVWRHLNKRSSTELFRVVDELGSSFSQVKMLFLLEDGGEHSVKEIAAHLGLSLPAASRAVDGLVERGFVTRRESEEDRRSRIIALSDYGREVVDRLTRARLATLDTFVAEITPEEQNALLIALLPIVERIKSSD